MHAHAEGRLRLRGSVRPSWLVCLVDQRLRGVGGGGDGAAGDECGQGTSSSLGCEAGGPDRACRKIGSHGGGWAAEVGSGREDGKNSASAVWILPLPLLIPRSLLLIVNSGLHFVKSIKKRRSFCIFSTMHTLQELFDSKQI